MRTSEPWWFGLIMWALLLALIAMPIFGQSNLATQADIIRLQSIQGHLKGPLR